MLDKILFAIPNVFTGPHDKISFFKTPPTKSSEKLASFQQEFDKLIQEIDPDIPEENLAGDVDKPQSLGMS